MVSIRGLIVGGWLVVLGCGGKVEEPDGEREPSPGDPQGQGAGGGAPGASGGGKVGACLWPSPKPEYSTCYSSPNPPCFSSDDPGLLEKLPALQGKSIRGPWVASDAATCRMLCCYGE